MRQASLVGEAAGSDGERPERAQPERSQPSIASVARQAGVSIATVSRVLNGIANKASPQTIERVRRAVSELGYRPAGAGQALRRRHSRLVAVLAANLANPTMAAIAASAEVALRGAGLVMVLCDTHDRPELQDEYLLEMRSHKVRATILLGAVESPGLARALASGEALVFVGRRCPASLAREAPFVGIDNGRAGREAADLLVRLEAQRPAVIHGSLASSATAERVLAFETRLEDLGLPVEARLVVGGSGLDHLEIGYEGMARLLAAGRDAPDAILCSSDLIAFGAHRRAAEAGVAERIVFVGFDDNPLNPWIAPWLSSIRIPYDLFGGAIVDAVTAPQSHSPGDRILAHSLSLRGPAARLREVEQAPLSPHPAQRPM